MKKSMLVVLVVLLLALFSLPGNVLAGPDDFRTFILSNELGLKDEGGLIKQLIDAEHGSESLYDILVLLAQPGSGIQADFVTSVGNNPAGSEVFTAPLSIIALPANNPNGISADGSLYVVSIFGRDYDGHSGFVTSTVQFSGMGPVNFTMAISPTYYIDAGSSDVPGQSYRAIGIAWAPTAQGVPEPSSLLLLMIGLACLVGKARRSRE